MDDEEGNVDGKESNPDREECRCYIKERQSVGRESHRYMRQSRSAGKADAFFRILNPFSGKKKALQTSEGLI
jgi:hypothetical protein